MMRNIVPVVCLIGIGLVGGCQRGAASTSADGARSGSVGSRQNILEQGVLDHNGTPVAAYYFHRTLRCPTCIAIEANAARVIEDHFTQPVEQGRLIWIPFNLDEPGGEELAKEFKVSANTLVLSKDRADGRKEYKKLEKVWNLIGSPAKFDAYVKSEIAEFLND